MKTLQTTRKWAEQNRETGSWMSIETVETEYPEPPSAPDPGPAPDCCAQVVDRLGKLINLGAEISAKLDKIIELLSTAGK